MKYKSFPAPFFNHFTYFIPPPIAKLKYLHAVLRGQFPHKKWSHTFVACPSPNPMTLKSSPIPSAPPSPINITAMIRQHT